VPGTSRLGTFCTSGLLEIYPNADAWPGSVLCASHSHVSAGLSKRALNILRSVGLNLAPFHRDNGPHTSRQLTESTYCSHVHDSERSTSNITSKTRDFPGLPSIWHSNSIMMTFGMKYLRYAANEDKHKVCSLLTTVCWY
jgi:hypothetical protein